jgi:hypothetical protein
MIFSMGGLSQGEGQNMNSNESDILHPAGSRNRSVNFQCWYLHQRDEGVFMCTAR